MKGHPKLQAPSRPKPVRMRLDALDVAIVQALQEDARLSLRAVAAKVGSTTPTVSARVKALEALGVLRGYHADVDPTAIPGRLALLTLTVRGEPAALAERARQVRGVAEVLVLAGGRLHVRVRGDEATVAEARARLSREPEVLTVDADDVVAVPHRAPDAPVGADVDVRCHQCAGPITDAVRATVGERAHVFCCRHCLASFKARYARAAARA